jgi:hypothetical protein
MLEHTESIDKRLDKLPVFLYEATTYKINGIHADTDLHLELIHSSGGK